MLAKEEISPDICYTNFVYNKNLHFSLCGGDIKSDDEGIICYAHRG